jgi:hypothetical protein
MFSRLVKPGMANQDHGISSRPSTPKKSILTWLVRGRMAIPCFRGSLAFTKQPVGLVIVTTKTHPELLVANTNHPSNDRISRDYLYKNCSFTVRRETKSSENEQFPIEIALKFPGESVEERPELLRVITKTSEAVISRT